MVVRLVAAVSATILLAACADAGEPRTAVVSAVLLDSLANRPVDSQYVHWMVGTTPDSAITSQSGAFTLTIPTGPVQLTYSDFGRYEDFDQTFTVRRDTTIVLRLRRTLPFLRSFSVTPSGTLSATIVDLQGAATVAQDNATWVVLNYGTVNQSSAIPAEQWTWTTVDGLTWSVTVNSGAAGISNAYWNVMDNQYPADFLCIAGQTVCTPNAP